MRQLILASQSPRRHELLKKAGFQFQTLSVEVSETLDENLNLDEALLDLAQRKGRALLDSGKLLNTRDILILSADTIVVINGEVLGKPRDQQEALDFLRRLSGNTHEVKTAVCIMEADSPKFVRGLETSRVTFWKNSDQQLLDYIATGDPMDKAGAYGIQTPEAKKLIQGVRGKIDNVMGLSIELVELLIERGGWDVGQRKLGSHP